MSHSATSVDRAAKMYPGVRGVVAASGHRLLLTFDTGETRVFDATPLLGTGRFKELTAPEVFKRVRVSFDTVEWDNGLDLDPEYLYDHSKPCPSGAAGD